MHWETKNFVTHFIATFALVRQSGTKSAISQSMPVYSNNNHIHALRWLQDNGADFTVGFQNSFYVCGLLHMTTLMNGISMRQGSLFHSLLCLNS